ncbi:peptidoglycan DD-metalloendopeptidase family protein [Tenacibaculum finnmarkense]|uniref:glycoside hydrolase family protein n=1 Tax=Tenacibaculum finnmarkense TaxID=2781243 RepID=UPI001EFB23F9|nr:peptidoglycan DD-metalloendopeptidase family protein [Tenacibaculum finnmarkense]MCG8894404.1 peptidoglycan DD-metalloendopeptidase family protein [Tenacibaculum finnmarkense]
MVPFAWEKKHGSIAEVPRYFYLKYEKEEFPRAYYTVKINTKNETNKKDSVKGMRVSALMLKVAKTLQLKNAIEGSNAVVLGEELKFEKSIRKVRSDIIFPLLIKPLNDLKGIHKNYYWAEKKQGDKWVQQAAYNSNRERGKRKHAARDMYTPRFTPVVAIADGEVIGISDNFADGTGAVIILHEIADGRKFIIRYGEVENSTVSVKVGQKIKQRTVLGKTGYLRKWHKKVVKGYDIYMLHFEYYTGDLGYNLDIPLKGDYPFFRRKDLADPLEILQEGYENTFGKNKNKDNRLAPKTLKTSEKGIQFIKDWEDFKSQYYNDSEGYCTIGYGHLIEKNKCENITIPKEFKNGITERKATELFKSRLVDFEKIIHNQVKVNLYQYEFDALVSLIFNIGCPDLKSNLDNANYKATAVEFKDITNGNTAGLVKRRNAEIKMFKNNVYDSTH